MSMTEFLQDFLQFHLPKSQEQIGLMRGDKKDMETLRSF